MNQTINILSEWLYGSLVKNRNAIFGFSILYIVLYHSEVWPIFGRGFIGVDVFLFLSAFGLCFSLEKHTVLNFYLRRLNRIYPLFVISNIFKWGIESWQGVKVGLWNTICDISGITFLGVGGTHLLWFIPSLMILYILTPPLHHIFSKFKNSAFYVIATLSLVVMMLFRNMDWHYACLVSRVPIFTLGLLYYIQKGDICKLSIPLLLCVFLQELAIANDLRFSASTFYAPVLLLVLCFIYDSLVREKLNKLISWLGSKSLECFIGNGMVTAFVIESGIIQRQIYYLLANIVWIGIFILINKLLPANR